MDQTQVFELSELQIGSSLRFDIYTTDGDLLLGQGKVVTEALLGEWSQAGITQGCVHMDPETEQPEASSQEEASESPASTAHAEDPADEEASESEKQQDDPPAAKAPPTDPREKLLGLYDEGALARLEENFAKASAATLEVAQLIATDELKNCQPVAETIESFLAEVESDIATVLASMCSTSVATEHDLLLAQRSAQLSVTSVVVCSTMGMSKSDCQTVGLAGMLHDIALYDSSRDAVMAIAGEDSTPQKIYQEHAIIAGSLLTYVADVSELTRQVITQVHEEPSGTGFPRGLSEHRIHPLAKVLGLVDAYLTLTLASQPEPLPPAQHLLPADAIAYLVYHAGQGNFDVKSARGLINSTSLYPVGSRVGLDDQSTATVLRSSSPTNPSEPIVRLDSSARSVVDLRHSHLSIARPLCHDSDPDAQRIRASAIESVVWRTTS